MNNLERLCNNFSIPIQPDEEGFTGRECPIPDCEGYFKVEFGTGLKGENLPCNCPYCGHNAPHDHFWTKEQIEYAKSKAMKAITDALYKDLKKHEFHYKAKGLFGIGISLKVRPGKPISIHHYREKKLETEIVCESCTLRYSVYGVFAFCPDCGQHNSLQTLKKNFEIVIKMLDLVETLHKEIAERIVENALEDCISSFDGFGRELCRVYANKSCDPAKAERVSFQNLDTVRLSLLKLFNFDLANIIDANEWDFLVKEFQKRHLLAHKMGIIDEVYIRKVNERNAIVGRKIAIKVEEIRELIKILHKTALSIAECLQKLP